MEHAALLLYRVPKTSHFIVVYIFTNIDQFSIIRSLPHSLEIPLHFSCVIFMCVAARNREYSPKQLVLGVQDRSKSSTLIPLWSSSPVSVVISSMSVPICNRFAFSRYTSQ